MPDESTILRFCHLPEDQALASRYWLRSMLGFDRGLMLNTGTVEDATLISAPCSTEREKDERDPG